MKRVVIHTDGGAKPNPGVGAWAAVLRHNDHVRELSGGELGTTNNRMEITAAIMALESLKEACIVELHTDSQYLKQGITAWMPGWKRKGWRGAGKNIIKNVDLWKRLDAALASHRIEWRWVKGHAGVADNELCDRLCEREIERLWRGSTEEQRASALSAEARRQADEKTAIASSPPPGDMFAGRM